MDVAIFASNGETVLPNDPTRPNPRRWIPQKIKKSKSEHAVQYTAECMAK